MAPVAQARPVSARRTETAALDMDFAAALLITVVPFVNRPLEHARLPRKSLPPRNLLTHALLFHIIRFLVPTLH
jgi:hypothetical protein